MIDAGMVARPQIQCLALLSIDAIHRSCCLGAPPTFLPAYLCTHILQKYENIELGRDLLMRYLFSQTLPHACGHIGQKQPARALTSMSTAPL